MTARGLRLSELLVGAGIRPLAPQAPPEVDPLIEGVTLDSRRVMPGDLFFALPGANVNGVRFVPDAIERGARAILAAAPRPAELTDDVAWVEVDQPREAAGLLSREIHGRPDLGLTLVGITGTNGKTTVTHLVESIAAADGRTTGMIGTVGHSIGNRVESAGRTTPEAPDFYRLLAEMRAEGVELVAIEVSSHALAMSRVAGARFAVAAFLNLSRDHLDFHGDAERYFEAKARLFDELGTEAHAVLPADEPHGAQLAARTRARVLTFGRHDHADVRLLDERLGADGSRATILTTQGSFEVHTPLLGRFNLDNVAAAVACALALDMPATTIARGIEALGGVPGRMERVDFGQPFAVVVDYAHTEDALENLLTTLRELTAGRLLVVFGCGGDRDQGKRFDMGRIAAERADRVFITSDNPRGEDPERILDQVAEGVASVGDGPSRCRRLVDRGEAIRAALSEAGAGDLVAIAGKGHERTLEIGDRQLPFDDREVALESLRRLGFAGGRHA